MPASSGVAEECVDGATEADCGSGTEKDNESGADTNHDSAKFGYFGGIDNAAYESSPLRWLVLSDDEKWTQRLGQDVELPSSRPGSPYELSEICFSDLPALKTSPWHLIHQFLVASMILQTGF